MCPFQQIMRNRLQFTIFGTAVLLTVWYVGLHRNEGTNSTLFTRKMIGMDKMKRVYSPTVQVGNFKLDFEQEQETRMTVFRNYCRRGDLKGMVNHDLKGPIANETISRFIVNDRYKILYCYVPKTGTTTTKHVFYNLQHGTSTTTKFLGSKHLTFLNQFPEEEIRRRLDTYIKFIVVRDPLERLASAWRNKFMDIRGGMRYWFIENYQSMLETIFDDNSGNKAVQAMDQLQTYKNGTLKHIPFLAFIKAIAENQTKWMNPHWQPVYQLCSPCQVNWDYIAHTETLAEDFHLFFKKAGIVGRDGIIPNIEERVGSTFYLQGFLKIPLEEIQRIWKIYKPDYDMFGYSFLKDLDPLFKQVVQEDRID